MPRPLTYQSSQAVIKYMNPNKRFQVSQSCPEFQRVDKIVPLRLDSIEVVFAKTMINNCTYHFRETRKEYFWIEDRDLGEQLQALDRMLDNLKVLQENLNLNSVEETIPKSKPHFYARDPNMDAGKLLGLMFGGRKEVNIKLLDLSNSHNSVVHMFNLAHPNSPMIHLPPGPKFKVEEINLGSVNAKILDNLVLTEPVDVLNTCKLEFDHPTIRNSKKLVISNMRDMIQEGTTIARLPNQWIHIYKFPDDHEKLLEFIRLVIIEWRSVKREPGTRLSVGLTYRVPAVLKSIEEEFRGEYLSDLSIKVPLRYSTDVHISFSECRQDTMLEMKII
uniref:FTH domain-containing protein n=1 Tax=Caenorhabditis tropicalis TaxID=1561998 RepID=A0A1I7UGQ9_9PELO